MTGLRLLGPRRLSRATDASTSIDSQDLALATYAKAHGHTIIPVTPDLSISGAVPIRERPGIGPWLTDDRLGDWDGVITAKLDRLFRSQADYVLFFRDYCEAHGKVIISASEGIDTSTETGKFIAGILVMFAEMERGRMRVRRRDAAERIREAMRFGGGRTPFGYEAYQDGGGWYLRLHQEHAQLVRWLAREVIEGRSCQALVVDMNRRGVLSPMGRAWPHGSVLRLLRSPVMRGYILHYPPFAKGSPRPPHQVVRDSDGMPLRREPVIDDATWAQLEPALDQNAKRRAGHRSDAAALLRVAFCVLDGAPLYSDAKVYRCAHRMESAAGPGKACRGLGVRVDGMDAFAEALFLAAVGGTEITRRVRIAGDNHAGQLAQIGQAITELTRERYERGVVHQDFDGKLAALMAEHARVSALPAEPDVIKLLPTGQTFRQRWDESDPGQRRALMLQAGFAIQVARLTVGPDTDGQRRAVKESQLRGVLGQVGADPSPESWQAIRRLADARSNLIIGWQLDPDLARRAGLAAEGRPVPGPDTHADWQRIRDSAGQPTRPGRERP